MAGARSVFLHGLLALPLVALGERDDQLWRQLAAAFGAPSAALLRPWPRFAGVVEPTRVVQSGWRLLSAYSASKIRLLQSDDVQALEWGHRDGSGQLAIAGHPGKNPTVRWTPPVGCRARVVSAQALLPDL